MWRILHYLSNLYTSDQLGDSNFSEHISANCTSKEVQKFLLFLKGSYGEAYTLFWLDVERLKQINNPDQQRQSIEKIKQLYLRNGAPFQFDSVIRKKIFFSSCEAKSLSEEISVLNSFQDHVLSLIRKYWFEQYLRQTFKSSKTEEDDSSDDSEEEEDQENPKIPLSRIIVDKGDETDDVIEGQHEKLKNLLEAQPIYLTSRRRADHYHRMKTNPFLTSSTHNLFDLSNKETTVATGREGWNYQRFLPFMKASIRCNFAAGNPILAFFKERFSDAKDPVDIPSNLLLLWLSIELLLTRDEMRRWFNSTVSSTSDTECPYFSLFQEYPLAADLESLLEMFIDDDSEFYVDLPNEVQRQLHLLLPRGLGKGLLLEAQEYVSKASKCFAICM